MELCVNYTKTLQVRVVSLAYCEGSQSWMCLLHSWFNHKFIIEVMRVKVMNVKVVIKVKGRNQREVSPS
jgi:hypothetical protein